MDWLGTMLRHNYYRVLLPLALALVICAIVYLIRSMGSAEAAKLPASLRLKGTSFYSSPVDSISGVTKGAREGSEYVVFDYETSLGEMSYKQTVVAIRTTLAETTSNLARASGLHFERAGEWLLVFEPKHVVSSDKQFDFIRDSFDLLNYSRDVAHQNL